MPRSSLHAMRIALGVRHHRTTTTGGGGDYRGQPRAWCSARGGLRAASPSDRGGDRAGGGGCDPDRGGQQPHPALAGCCPMIAGVGAIVFGATTVFPRCRNRSTRSGEWRLRPNAHGVFIHLKTRLLSLAVVPASASCCWCRFVAEHLRARARRLRAGLAAGCRWGWIIGLDWAIMRCWW